MGVCGRPILESGEEAVGRGLALRAGREDVEGAGKGGGNPCLPACLLWGGVSLSCSVKITTGKLLSTKRYSAL